ncbi:MAG TPA: glycosyltransferase family 87 protein, partial [Urbifossiella sp.]
MAEPLANQEVSPANAIEPLPLVAVAIFLIFALFHVRTTNQQPDFFIYRLGAELALRGESPYNLALIRTHVVAQFPNQEEGPDSFVNNCGYFLPPMAVLIYAPFAVLPWPAAKIAWAIVSTIAVFGITRIPILFLANGRRTTTAGADRAWNSYVPILLVVYVLMLAIFQVGQTTTLCVGCVALGQWCFEKGRPSLGLLLWSVAFIKPHVALPLVPLAWYLGGWKRAAA